MNRFTNDPSSPLPPHRASGFTSSSPPRVLHSASPGHRNSAPNATPFTDAWANQVQLSLAIMGPEKLRSLLLQTTPPPIVNHRLGQVSLRLEVPLRAEATADGILRFEVISCRLADPASTPVTGTGVSPSQHHRAMVNQIRCETKLHNLGLNLTLTEAIARLQYAFFSSGDIQRILNLPYHGWHRSWWEMVDPSDEFALPFQRLMRSRRYADGTVTLQYKDQFGYLPPPCFHSHSETVLLHIQRPGASFTTTLAEINQARESLGLNHAILIYRHLSKPESQAFRHQGVRLYPWQGEQEQSEERPSGSGQSDRPPPSSQQPRNPHKYGSITVLPTALPPQATSVSVDCQRCRQNHCTMQGNPNSPVTACQQFTIDPPPNSPGMADGANDPPPTPMPSD
ncbi:MAG: hypothetical protein AB4042_15480 [Leptolyngbyaceae cyanobacterium]